MSEQRNMAAETAEMWFVHLESGEATVKDRARFDAWLSARPEHRMAYEQVAALSDSIGTLRHLSLQQKSWLRGRTGITGIAAAILLSVAATLTWTYVGNQHDKRYATPIAHLQTIPLKDGSTVTLGASSSITVAYTDDERHVTLRSGEAFFSVRSDPGRPFIVDAAGTRLRVVGTQFSVQTGEQRVTVAVAEGAVDVSKTKPTRLFSGVQRAERLRLVAGQKLIVAREDGELSEVKPIKTEEAGRWRQGLLVYDNVPLREVVEDANRYSTRRIMMIPSEIGDLKVTAAYRGDQVDLMLAGLADLLPIAIDRSATDRIVLRPED